MTEKHKYLDMIIDDSYDLLVSNPNPFPKDYTRAQKLELLDSLIVYLSNMEQFERCNELTKMRENILLRGKKGK